ncbi:hypothetical protein DN435_07930, partial [Lactobacillus reuteri]|nr:hypothetical protein [Limosilactobacillus reuteri]
RDWADSFFSENDKTPLLDGNILIYSSKKHSNANLIGSIRCQIKSTTAKNVKKNRKYYQLNRDYLTGIQKLGGALLFVVWVKDPDNYKIYYQRLTRLYITTLLENSSAQRPAIPLTGFPVDTNNRLDVLRQAAFDLNATVENKLVEIERPDKVILPTYMLDPKNFKASMDNLENQNLTIYAEKDGSLHPLALVNNDGIELVKTELDDNKVKFGDMGPFNVRRYSSQRKKDKEPLIHFITGASDKLTITVHNPSQKKNRVTMKVNKANNISDQLTNIKIMKYLVTNGKINLNGNTIDLSKNMIPLGNDKIKEIDGWLNELSAIQEVSHKLNINFYRDYENGQLVNQLNALLNFVNDREQLSEREIVPGIFNYGDKLIGIIKTRDNYWNFFDKELVNHIQIFGASRSNKDQVVEINPYLIAEQYQNSITKYIGYNFDVVFRWFNSHIDIFEKEVVRNQATFFCEDLMMNSNNPTVNGYWARISKLQSIMGHLDDDRLFLDHMLVQRKLRKKMNIDENERLNKLVHTDDAVKRLYAGYLLNVEVDQGLIDELNKDDLEWLKRLKIVSTDTIYSKQKQGNI